MSSRYVVGFIDTMTYSFSHYNMDCLQESKEDKNGEIVKTLEHKRIKGIKFSEMLEQMQSAAPRRKSPMLDTLKSMS